MQNPDDPAAFTEAMEIFARTGYVFGTDHQTGRWRHCIEQAACAQGLPVHTGLTAEGWWWAAAAHLTADEQELLLTVGSANRVGARRLEVAARRAHPANATRPDGPVRPARHLRLVR